LLARTMTDSNFFLPLAATLVLNLFFCIACIEFSAAVF